MHGKGRRGGGHTWCSRHAFQSGGPSNTCGSCSSPTSQNIRRQRIPVHTIGFGSDHPDRDVEIQDVVLPARALPQSRLSATVTLRSYGASGARTRLSVKDGGKGAARAIPAAGASG